MVSDSHLSPDSSTADSTPTTANNKKLGVEWSGCCEGVVVEFGVYVRKGLLTCLGQRRALG